MRWLPAELGHRGRHAGIHQSPPWQSPAQIQASTARQASANPQKPRWRDGRLGFEVLSLRSSLQHRGCVCFDSLGRCPNRQSDTFLAGEGVGEGEDWASFRRREVRKRPVGAESLEIWMSYEHFLPLFSRELQRSLQANRSLPRGCRLRSWHSRIFPPWVDAIFFLSLLVMGPALPSFKSQRPELSRGLCHCRGEEKAEPSVFPPFHGQTFMCAISLYLQCPSSPLCWQVSTHFPGFQWNNTSSKKSPMPLKGFPEPSIFIMLLGPCLFEQPAPSQCWPIPLELW